MSGFFQALPRLRTKGAVPGIHQILQATPDEEAAPQPNFYTQPDYPFPIQPFFLIHISACLLPFFCCFDFWGQSHGSGQYYFASENYTELLIFLLLLAECYNDVHHHIWIMQCWSWNLGLSVPQTDIHSSQLSSD